MKIKNIENISHLRYKFTAFLSKLYNLFLLSTGFFQIQFSVCNKNTALVLHLNSPETRK